MEMNFNLHTFALIANPGLNKYAYKQRQIFIWPGLNSRKYYAYAAWLLSNRLSGQAVQCSSNNSSNSNSKFPKICLNKACATGQANSKCAHIKA